MGLADSLVYQHHDLEDALRELPIWEQAHAAQRAGHVLRCRCGGRRRILAAITQRDVIVAILAALGLPTEAPVVHAARDPPRLFDGE